MKIDSVGTPVAVAYFLPPEPNVLNLEKEAEP
jgi:hypothetical protein